MVAPTADSQRPSEATIHLHSRVITAETEIATHAALALTGADDNGFTGNGCARRKLLEVCNLLEKIQLV